MKREDFQSPIWARLEQEVLAKIEERKAQLESFSMTNDETARTRGRIAELRWLLSLRTAAESANDNQPVARSSYVEDV